MTMDVEEREIRARLAHLAQAIPVPPHPARRQQATHATPVTWATRAAPHLVAAAVLVVVGVVALGSVRGAVAPGSGGASQCRRGDGSWTCTWRTQDWSLLAYQRSDKVLLGLSAAGRVVATLEQPTELSAEGSFLAATSDAGASRYVIGLRPLSVETISVTLADGHEVRAQLRSFTELKLGLYVAELPVATTPIQSIRFFGPNGELYGAATRLASDEHVADQRGGHLGPVQLTEEGQREQDADATVEVDAGTGP